MYEIKFTDKAKIQFLKLENEIQERMGSVLERIKIRPDHFVEKLVGEPGYKLRVGDYRVLFSVNNNLITIWKVGHRKNIYKR